ncbi:MAG TPA: ABC transporter substrate-binding protein [Acetobacteraceae bacterium]|nr:ABC transporter substrate-binding protein [Acetobacteraceae bacterium]
MLTRRHLLAVSAAAPALHLSPGRADTPRDAIVMGSQIDDIISLDPHESFEFSGNELSGQCYQKLVIPDLAENNQIVGQLAESWSVSPDGLVFTFHLRPDAVFSSGNPVTAADAVFSLTRAVTMNKTPAFIIRQFGFDEGNVAKLVQETGAKSFTLTLPKPAATTFFLNCLSANVGSIVDKTEVLKHEANGDLGNAWLKSSGSAGSGAFTLQAWRANDVVILNANPRFAPQPSFRRFIARHVPDAGLQFLQLQRGDLDIVRNLTPEQIRQALADPKFRVVTANRAQLLYLNMNTAYAPLAKPEVWQAIKWALDYEGIQKSLVPQAYNVWQAFLPRGIPGAIEDMPFRKDDARARALLAQAGYPDGFEVTFDHPATNPIADIAQAVQQNVASVGIKMTLLRGDSRQVTTKVRARHHQIATGQWGSDYFDPNSNAQWFCENIDNSDASPLHSGAWIANWQDKSATDRAIAAASETDAEKRMAIYAQLQRDLQARSPYAMMLQAVAIATTRAEVSGLTLGAVSDRTNYAKMVKA